MDRDFARQVLTQTAGTVLGGLILYGLAAVGGLITVHPHQALIALGAGVALIAGLLHGYMEPDPDAPWYGLRDRHRILRLALGLAIALTFTGGIDVVNKRTTSDQHNHCTHGSCQK